MGEKNHKKAEQVLANSFLMLSIFSVLLTVSFLLLKNKLLMLFGASGATFPFANTYLTIYTTGTFFALMATGEYSCAVTPQVRQTGNRLSGLAGTAYASLLT